MKHKLFISGNIDDDSIIKLDKNSNKVYDLMTLDSFAIYNAIATAEGTIANLILESNYNLYNESVLILGFGKCGKILADRLKGLGSKVTIAARKMQDEAFIESLSYGFINYKNLRTNIKNFKFIINTVPTLLIKKEELDNVSNETLIIDIASKPGGIDFTYAKEKNIKCLHLLGIPGKFAPESSASIIYNMIQKLGE